MLKIGEFSILSSISIHMLRHYDEIGLLKPDCVGMKRLIAELPSWNRSFDNAVMEEICGELIERISEKFTQMILSHSYSDLPGCIPLFEKLLESETKAYSQFLIHPLTSKAARN